MAGWPYSEMEDGDVIEEHENLEEAALQRAVSNTDAARALRGQSPRRPAHGGYPEAAGMARMVEISTAFDPDAPQTIMLGNGEVVTIAEYAAMLRIHEDDDGAA